MNSNNTGNLPNRRNFDSRIEYEGWLAAMALVGDDSIFDNQTTLWNYNTGEVEHEPTINTENFWNYFPTNENIELDPEGAAQARDRVLAETPPEELVRMVLHTLASCFLTQVFEALFVDEEEED